MGNFDLLLAVYVLAVSIPVLIAPLVPKVLRAPYIVLYSYPFFKSASFIIVPSLSVESYQKTVLEGWLLINILYSTLISFFIVAVLCGAKTRRSKFVPQEALFSQTKDSKVFFFLALMMLAVLIIISDGRFLYSPRKAYELDRSGFGMFWVMYYLALSVVFYVTMYKPRSRGKDVLLLCGFIYLYYLTGSKHLILSCLIAGYVVLTVKHGSMPIVFKTFGGVLALMLLMLNFDQLGSEDPFFERVQRYFSSLSLAYELFSDLSTGRLQHGDGEVFMSSFWSYIPRIVYESKPSAYGPLVLNEIYFPGQAAAGLTVSFGPLSSSFYDFGYLAPFIEFITDIKTLSYSIAIGLFGAGWLNIRRSLWMPVLLAPGFGWGLPGLIFFCFCIFIGFLYLRKSWGSDDCDYRVNFPVPRINKLGK